MKIVLKEINHNGANTLHNFNTVKEAEVFLNEALYYCGNVYLSYLFGYEERYNSKTRLSHLMKDAVKYGEGYITCYWHY